MVSGQLYEVTREKDAARVTAAAVGPLRALALPSIAPKAAPNGAATGADAAKHSDSIAAALALCCEAGLLPSGDKPTPLKQNSSDAAARNKAAERSSVGVFSQPKARFPLLPVARGTRESYSRERVWVGDALNPRADNPAPEVDKQRQADDKSPGVFVAKYDRLMEQSDEVPASSTGGGGGPAKPQAPPRKDPPRRHQKKTYAKKGRRYDSDEED